VRPKSWLNLPHLPTLLSPVTAKNRVVKFQEMSLNRLEITVLFAHDILNKTY